MGESTTTLFFDVFPLCLGVQRLMNDCHSEFPSLDPNPIDISGRPLMWLSDGLFHCSDP